LEQLEKFGCNIKEALIRETADQMVTTGMKDAGYTYVIIDDCWHGKRDAQGNIKRMQSVSKRYQGVGRLCSQQRTKVWHLF